VRSCSKDVVIEDDVANRSGTTILFVAIVRNRRVGALLGAYTSSHSSSFTTRHRIHIGENIAEMGVIGVNLIISYSSSDDRVT